MGDGTGLVVTSVGLGFAYAALPGAVNAEALRRGLAGGFWRAFQVHAGALLGAGFWAVLALTGTSLLARYDAITITLGLVGAAVLLRLAAVAVRGALTADLPTADAPRSGADLSTGVIVGIANPAGFPFWTGLASDIVLRGGGSLDPNRGALFLGGVLLGSLAWGLLLSALIAWGRRYLRAGFFRAVNGLCAVAFGYFALRMLWSTANELFR
jgi:chemosensory pili system protein ChpE